MTCVGGVVFQFLAFLGATFLYIFSYLSPVSLSSAPMCFPLPRPISCVRGGSLHALPSFLPFTSLFRS